MKREFRRLVDQIESLAAYADVAPWASVYRAETHDYGLQDQHGDLDLTNYRNTDFIALVRNNAQTLVDWIRELDESVQAPPPPPPIPPGWKWDETFQEYQFPDGFGDTVFLGFLGNCVQIGCRVGPDSEGDREEGDEDAAVITRREDALQIACRLKHWAETKEVPRGC